MVINRIFLCHIASSEKAEEAQILQYIIEALGKAGLEIIMPKKGDTNETFFQQIKDELSIGNAFLLFHTSETIDPIVISAVKKAKALFDQKRLQGIFRFICPSATEAMIPPEWKDLTAFDGTHDYQRACAQLIASLAALSKDSNDTVNSLSPKDAKHSPEQTNVVNSSIPLGIMPAITMPALGHRGVMDQPAQTAMTNAANGSTPLEVVTPSTPPPAQPVSITDRPSSTDSSRSLQIAPTSALPVLRRVSPPPRPARTNYDRPPKLSIWQRLAEKRKLLAGLAIALVVLALIGSAGTLFALNASSAKPVTQAAAPNTHAAPATATPNPTIGEVSFLNSDQIGVDNDTGIADEVQVNLQHITSPGAGNSYHAWLLPNPGNSQEGKNLLLGPLTVNNGSATLTFTNPTHENLLLTESTFLVTEESTNPVPSVPSPDQRLWRYSGIIPQTPNPNDPSHSSKLDHIRHLLGADPILQDLKLQGGLSTWFYTNVQKVFELSNAAEGLGQQQNVFTLHNTLVRILDYLDGTNNVADDVPMGTPFLIQPPEIAQIPLLTLDPVNQNPVGFIDHLETHLQGLTVSPGTRGSDQKLAAQVDNKLEKIRTHLQKVREDAKQLANLSLMDLAGPKTAPTLTDMLDQAKAALVGELDPTTNTRQGGATFVLDVLPQLATIDIKKFKGL